MRKILIIICAIIGMVNFAFADTTDITCSAGYYLSANSTTCTICPGDSYCVGGTYTFSETTAQGATACPAGYDYNTSSGKTSATQCQIHCDAGTYVAGYTQLEYIESTGTQYIDTGYIPTSGTRTEVDLSFTSDTFNLSGITSIFGVFQAGVGSYSANFGNVYQAQAYEVYNWLCVYGTSGCNVSVCVINATLRNTRQTYVLDAQNKTASYGSVQNSLSQYISNPSKSIYLFGLHRIENDGTEIAKVYSANGGMFIYETRIYEYGELVHKFIPVRRNSDGAIGMYDTVTKTFFRNSGTGEFVAGPDTEGVFPGDSCANVGLGYYAGASTINYGSAGTKTACPIGTYSDITNGAACKSCTGATYSDTTALASCKACPAGYDYNTNTGKTSATQCQIHCDAGNYVMREYTQLEYIESTGTQYIDTGHIPTSGTRTEVDLRFTSDTFNLSGITSIFGVSQAGVGAYSANFGNVYQVQAYEVFNWLCPYGTSGCNESACGINATLRNTRQTYVLDAQNKTASYGSVQNSLSQYVSHPSKSIYLFGWHRIENDGTETAQVYSANDGMFIYETRIYEYGELVHKFIPVRRNSDGAIGMYDTVTGTFFGNSGTGTFVAGPDINNGFGGAVCMLCTADSYCTGGTYPFNETLIRGITACATGLFAPRGMWEPEQCGRILHVGDGFVYLRSTKKTEHALHVDLNHDGVADYFGNMTTLDVPMSSGTQRKLKLRWNNTTYSVYDDSVDLSLYQ